MSNIEQTIFCDGCGVEIFWGPVVKGNKQYCCQDCLAGRPCQCGERQEMEDDRLSRSTPSYPPGAP
ncbi:MAG TPA: hypothetical protein VI451_16045 [Anaerolineales bacterium]|nr:hypothetical protein [Anaerolineales bacterium]